MLAKGGVVKACSWFSKILLAYLIYKVGELVQDVGTSNLKCHIRGVVYKYK